MKAGNIVKILHNERNFRIAKIQNYNNPGLILCFAFNTPTKHIFIENESFGVIVDCKFGFERYPLTLTHKGIIQISLENLEVVDV